jgi:hypothetical protein
MTKINMMNVLVLAVLMSGLTGCFGLSLFNKGDTTTRTTTTGKELIDLQDAKAKGALTEEEYVRARKNLLKDGSAKGKNVSICPVNYEGQKPLN